MFVMLWAMLQNFDPHVVLFGNTNNVFRNLESTSSVIAIYYFGIGTPSENVS